MGMYPFTFWPKGPFDLLNQNQYFNGWPTLAGDETSIVMAFPVEGWETSAAVTLQQQPDGMLKGAVYGALDEEQAKLALAQGLAALSLDVDGSDWTAIGERDPYIGKLQQAYKYMRPTLFHSPYEAACAFVIGHRIRQQQSRKIRAQMAEQYGEAINARGQVVHAFVQPQKLLKITSYPGLSEAKIMQLHAVAQAALDGLLGRAYLRSFEPEEALEKLQTLPGIGPFFSQGILYRGAGVADGVTSDDISQYAIRKNYGLPDSATQEDLLNVAEAWHPYRMWAIVLMHVWQREHKDLPMRKVSRS